MIAILDSGPLYAVVDPDDRAHERSRATIQSPDLNIVIPTMVVAEVTYFVGQRLGPGIESAFLMGLSEFIVEAPSPEDWPRIAELVRRYANFPLGGTDASVVALAERLNTDLVITLDRRHFAAIRPRHCPAFRLLPD